MDPNFSALPREGAGNAAQNFGKYGEAGPRDRRFLLFTAGFCVLMANTLLRFGPTAGLTVLTCAWYALVLAYLGPSALALRSNRVLLAGCLLLAASLALGSSWYFRLWNLLALLALLPLHALGLSGAARLAWYRPAMLWERLCLLLWGMLGHVGAAWVALTAGPARSQSHRSAALVLGLAGAAALVAVLVPVLSSADALFASATAGLRAWGSAHLSGALRDLLAGLALTPFFFGFLYLLRHPAPLKRELRSASPCDALAPAADAVAGSMVSSMASTSSQLPTRVRLFLIDIPPVPSMLPQFAAGGPYAAYGDSTIAITMTMDSIRFFTVYSSYV